MKSIVYKTTNIVNGKFYIGVHTKNNPRYLGSGKLLIRSIKKYGRDNFVRETLKEFDNEQDAYNYEELLVDVHMVENRNCYNVMVGGVNPPTMTGKDHPNFGVIFSNETRLKMSESAKIKTFSKSHRENISKATSGTNNPMYGKNHSEESKQCISIKRIIFLKDNIHPWVDRKHAKDSKIKMSNSRKGCKHSSSTKNKMSKSHQKFVYHIEGKSYTSIRHASKELNIHHNTILHRCKNPNVNTYQRIDA